MNWKKFFFAFIAAFVFVFLYEWVFHGMLMARSYKEIPTLWRPESEMMNYFPILICGQLVLVFFFTLIFVRGFGSGGGIGGGFRYGVLVALLCVGGMIIQYAVQPLTTHILLCWAAGGVIEFAIAGAIIGAIYKPATA